MKKFKISMILAVCLLIISISVVFAAFMFNQVVSSNARVGNIYITGKNFISYAPDVDYNDYTGGKADEGYLGAIWENEETGVPFTQDSVVCYATVKEGYNEEIAPTTEANNRNYFYLKQLGFQIKFKTDIDVYIRIHFSDAWIRTKTYNGNAQDPEYVMRDHFDLDSTDTNWVYDSKTNTQNYKQLIEATDENEERVFTFNIDPNYYYAAEELVGGHQSIMVQVSFTVDIVQANRAYKLWGYEPTSLTND